LPFLHIQWRLLPAPVLVIISLFSFVATSPPPGYFFSYNHGQGNVRFHGADYKLKMSKSAVINKLHSLGLQVEIDSTLMETVRQDSWYYYDTLSLENAQYYLIRKMILDEDTLNNIQFGLRQFSDSKTRFYLNALTTSSSVDSIQVERQLRRVYKKFLKREVIHSLRRD
jgi:hypothetical protein